MRNKNYDHIHFCGKCGAEVENLYDSAYVAVVFMPAMFKDVDKKSYTICEKCWKESIGKLKYAMEDEPQTAIVNENQLKLFKKREGVKCNV